VSFLNADRTALAEARPEPFDERLVRELGVPREEGWLASKSGPFPLRPPTPAILASLYKMARPIVCYATTGDGLEIAYEVLGDGPLDVVIVPGLISRLVLDLTGPDVHLRHFQRHVSLPSSACSVRLTRSSSWAQGAADVLGCGAGLQSRGERQLW
jgi:hypothetical protein